MPRMPSAMPAHRPATRKLSESAQNQSAIRVSRPKTGKRWPNVQNAIQKWGYYQLTIRRSEADLVVLRKGRTAGAYVGGHAGTGIEFPGDPSSTHKPEVGVVAGADAGSNVDIL